MSPSPRAHCPLPTALNLKTFHLYPERVGGGGGEVGGILLGILRGGVPPGSPNPDTISDQKYVTLQTCFQTKPPKSIPVFRPVLWAPDLAFR